MLAIANVETVIVFRTTVPVPEPKPKLCLIKEEGFGNDYIVAALDFESAFGFCLVWLLLLSQFPLALLA